MLTEPLPAHIRALLDKAAYSHATDDIRLIQTHISWVILTGPYAYKLKKPQSFGFLDFSTLERRKHFCGMELELNRRLAPDLYLDVLPVCRHDDTYMFGDDGDVVDYCIKMRQFEQSALLFEHIRHDDFDPACMDILAANLADFYASHPCQGDPGSAGSADLLLQHMIDNLQAGQVLGNAEITSTVQELEAIARHEIEQLRAAIEQRRQNGFVRQCHGDLHLNNIALIDGKPTVFDCIEFNDDYRIIDIMNDIAFLCMDCDAHARPDLGFRFLSRYLEHGGDYAGLKLFHLYASYRASVRAKVACLRAQEAGLSQEARLQKIAEAKRYFQLAVTYGQAKTPCLFAIGGLSGSGKSHMSLLGCGPERAIIIRSDATRKRLAGEKPCLSRYGKAMTELTYAAMFTAARQILDAGLSVILDATFLNIDHRNRFRDLARQTRTPTRFLWLELPEQQLRQRVAGRSDQGQDISDANLDVLEKQWAEYQRPNEPGIEFLTDSECWPDKPVE